MQRFLILGSGSISQTFLPMFFQVVAPPRANVSILSDDVGVAELAEHAGVKYHNTRLTPENFVGCLEALVGKGDCIINLTGGVSARDLVRFSLERGIHYIDTSNERWEFGATYDDSADFAQQWNLMISDRDVLPRNSTALVSHGANPGLVSHFAKQALSDIGAEAGLLKCSQSAPSSWAKLAGDLGVCALHISETDTQASPFDDDSGILRNTWSVEGLLEECHSSPCFALGSHEPLGSANEQVRKSISIRRERVYDVAFFDGQAKNFRTRSWVPSLGGFNAMITPHEEVFSIAELLTTGRGAERYQPTVMFTYQPCRAAQAGLALGEAEAAVLPSKVMSEEISSGYDELGILVLRKQTDEVYWFGSTLGIDEARTLLPQSNATGVQVAAGVLGGLVWLLENPEQGLVSAEYADHRRVLEVAAPWLGELGGTYGRWSEANESPLSLLQLKTKEND